MRTRPGRLCARRRPALGPAVAASPVAVVSGKGSGRVSAAGLICFKPGARSRFFYQIRVHTGRKGERRSMSEADYAGLVTAAHNQLHAPLILAQQGWACMISLRRRTGRYGATSQTSRPTSITANNRQGGGDSVMLSRRRQSRSVIALIEGTGPACSRSLASWCDADGARISPRS